MKKYIAILPFLLLGMMTFGQDGVDLENDTSLVQFSGMILTDADGVLEPVPYATISVKGESRGTYTNYRGFFSIVVHKGDKVQFSSIGYRDAYFTIPDTLQGSRYSVVQLITSDTINLPETVIFPWPDRDHFKLEFLAMDVSQDLDERAKDNLAEKRLEAIRKNTKMDAAENADYYLRQEAQSYYSIGQAPPMNIFNPMAWAQFFQAWKSGEYKKQ
jgi:hypothetical protein